VDGIAFAEFALEARHELAVPAIVNAFASSLNEEDLLSHGVILFDGTGRCKAAASRSAPQRSSARSATFKMRPPWGRRLYSERGGS
jgi:hypothetical protein